MFIKRMLPEGMMFLGTVVDADKKALKADFEPIIEKFWWQIEKGQPLPVGLELIYDGVPPGHCTLTCNREMSVHEFMGLVSLLVFKNVGADYYVMKK